MVTQADVDRLQADLEKLRGTVIRKRSVVEPQVDAIIRKAEHLQTEAKGGKFEPAIDCVLDLLNCFRSGIRAQDELNRCQPVRKAG